MDTHTKTSEKDVKGFYLIADVRDRIAVVGGIDGDGRWWRILTDVGGGHWDMGDGGERLIKRSLADAAALCLFDFAVHDVTLLSTRRRRASPPESTISLPLSYSNSPSATPEPVLR